MNIWIVIPARKGSKGFPNKNKSKLAGHSLIEYTIAAAKKLEFVSKIILTTDDLDLIELARQNGIEAPFIRPADKCADESRDYEFCKHLLDYYQETHKLPDALLLLRIVTPLRYLDDLINSYKVFELGGFDSLRSICQAKEQPYKMWVKSDESEEFKGAYKIKPLIQDSNIYECYNAPRQILPKSYISTGSFEYISVKCILEKGSVTGTRVLGFEVKEETCIDIDSSSDLEEACKRITFSNFITP